MSKNKLGNHHKINLKIVRVTGGSCPGGVVLGADVGASYKSGKYLMYLDKHTQMLGQRHKTLIEQLTPWLFSPRIIRSLRFQDGQGDPSL